ncbi:MAG: HEPN domain-containing protein [Nanoarchaeota archaeon]|nr:HEPN domain-containing protein [Nanoarchaeota archaeon]
MKRANFLAKLYKKETIQIVEPSEDIAGSYLVKSESNLVSAKILLQNNKLEESVGLAYYSMYHALTALLFKVGIKCGNHAASIILLKKLFGIDNTDISLAKSERVDKQYYVDFHITKAEVEETIKTSEQFNRKLLDFISKLNKQSIAAFRIKFKDLLE